MKKKKSEDKISGPELFIGLVGAVGTDLELVSSALQDSLSEVNYKFQTIQLSKLLHEIDEWKNLSSSLHEDQRYHKHMDAGNELCQNVERGDALAVLAFSAIAEHSGRIKKDSPEIFFALRNRTPRCAYILRSLKRTEEVETLREIYGPNFFLVAAYSPRETRLQKLAGKIADSYGSNQTDKYLDKAQSIIIRDEKESDKIFGQNVSNTFPKADVFINAGDPIGLRKELKRFIELLFGYPFHTPTRDEYSMFHAHAAALRSSSLSRQVGAVISTEDGDIIAVGTNEVPKARGGLYWSDDTLDCRDFRFGYETSDRMKKNTVAELLNCLKEAKWLSEKKSKVNLQNLVNSALPLTNDTQIMNLIEFGRSEHAEMAALIDAARRGVSIKGATLYTTTFPCHDCARHIITAGIRRVVYIEPYPKSRAFNLHSDSIAIDTFEEGIGRVSFHPFVGIAPRQYMELFSFSKGQRVRKDGKIVEWEQTKSNALPRFVRFPQHLQFLSYFS